MLKLKSKANSSSKELMKSNVASGERADWSDDLLKDRGSGVFPIETTFLCSSTKYSST